MATNYYADNPINGLVNGLLQGSQIGLQMRQLQNQEEQQKIANEDKQLATAIEMFKVTKNPQMQKMIAENYLTPALINRGYLAPGQKFTYDGTPAAKNYFQIVSDANNMIEKGLWTKDQAQEHVLDETIKLKDAGESGVPSDMQGSIRKDVGPPVADKMIGLIQYPEQFKDQPEYSTPEAKAGILGYQKSLVPQISALDESKGVAVQKALEASNKKEEYKAPQPWGFTTGADGKTRAFGFDPGSKKIVSYDVPFDGQVTPFAAGRTPAAEIKSATQLDTLKDNINRIRDNFKSSYVGFVTGRARQLQSNTVGGLPEEQTTFYADVNDLSDMLLRARSGAQINEQEYQRLTRLVPTPNMPADTFSSRLNRFEEQVNQILGNQQKRLKAGGYLPMGGTSTNKPSPKPKTWEELKKLKGIQ